MSTPTHFCWRTWRFFRLRKPVTIPWDSLQLQFGCSYNSRRHFKRRIQATGKGVVVQVCHPGASRTNLLKDTANRFNKIVWSITSRIVAQSAEKGSWPEVICATEEGLKPETLYGPTKRMEMVGPIGEGPLEKLVLDRDMATKLWTLSEQKTELSWSP